MTKKSVNISYAAIISAALVISLVLCAGILVGFQLGSKNVGAVPAGVTTAALPIEKGGTGSSSLAGAQAAMGLTNSITNSDSQFPTGKAIYNNVPTSYTFNTISATTRWFKVAYVGGGSTDSFVQKIDWYGQSANEPKNTHNLSIVFKGNKTPVITGSVPSAASLSYSITDSVLYLRTTGTNLANRAQRFTVYPVQNVLPEKNLVVEELTTAPSVSWTTIANDKRYSTCTLSAGTKFNLTSSYCIIENGVLHVTTAFSLKSGQTGVSNGDTVYSITAGDGLAVTPATVEYFVSPSLDSDEGGRLCATFLSNNSLVVRTWNVGINNTSPYHGLDWRAVEYSVPLA